MRAPDLALRSGLASAEYADAMVIHDDWDDVAIEDHRLLPPLEHTDMVLPPAPDAPAVARGFVAHTLREWRLPSMVAPAGRVLGELVAPAASRGDSDLEVRLSRVDTRIRMAMTNPVADTSAMVDLPEYPPTGRSRQVVQALVDGWGVIAGRPAGCTVWAVMDASGANAPARHRGRADTDALAELHNRTVGRHRRA